MSDQARIDEILVGERARKDYGDLTSLMESISEHGLLQPIGLAPGNHLLFGGRRLEACRRLGWAVIPITRPATQDDALSLLKAERDENTCRKDMTPEELVDLGLRLEVMEREKGREQQAWRRGGGTFSSGEEKVPHHKTDHAVGDALGMSPAQYFRAKSVVRASRDPEESPKVQEVAQVALAKMNAGEETIGGAYAKVRDTRREDAGLPPATTRRPKPEAPEPAPERPPAPAPPKYSGGNRAKHLQMLDSLTVSLSALALAANEIQEFDRTVTNEEAARLTSDLSRHIKSLQALNNRLKERTK